MSNCTISALVKLQRQNSIEVMLQVVEGFCCVPARLNCWEQDGSALLRHILRAADHL